MVGLRQLQVRYVLVYFQSDRLIIFLLVYVDDVIITDNDISMINRLITVLDKEFALKGLSVLNYFLGLQVHYLDSRFIINQEKYVDDLLHKLQLEDLKPAASPCVLDKHLSLSDSVPLKDPFIYHNTIGVSGVQRPKKPQNWTGPNRTSWFSLVF